MRDTMIVRICSYQILYDWCYVDAYSYHFSIFTSFLIFFLYFVLIILINTLFIFPYVVYTLSFLSVNFYFYLMKTFIFGLLSVRDRERNFFIIQNSDRKTKNQFDWMRKMNLFLNDNGMMIACGLIKFTCSRTKIFFFFSFAICSYHNKHW